MAPSSAAASLTTAIKRVPDAGSGGREQHRDHPQLLRAEWQPPTCSAASRNLPAAVGIVANCYPPEAESHGASERLAMWPQHPRGHRQLAVRIEHAAQRSSGSRAPCGEDCAIIVDRNEPAIAPLDKSNIRSWAAGMFHGIALRPVFPAWRRLSDRAHRRGGDGDRNARPRAPAGVSCRRAAARRRSERRRRDRPHRRRRPAGRTDPRRSGAAAASNPPPQASARSEPRNRRAPEPALPPHAAGARTAIRRTAAASAAATTAAAARRHAAGACRRPRGTVRHALGGLGRRRGARARRHLPGQVHDRGRPDRPAPAHLPRRAARGRRWSPAANGRGARSSSPASPDCRPRISRASSPPPAPRSPMPRSTRPMRSTNSSAPARRSSCSASSRWRRSRPRCCTGRCSPGSASSAPM